MSIVHTGSNDQCRTEFHRARQVVPSQRCELEIVSLLEMYLADEQLTVQQMGRGFAWLETGTHGSLLDAGNFVRTLQARQGLQVGCPEEIAHRNGWIDDQKLEARATQFAKSDYGAHLQTLLRG